MAYPLPYAFAREHELLLEDKDGSLTHTGFERLVGGDSHDGREWY